jgi:hypothetical protein
MGLIDAFRRLVNFGTLNKIKKAIDGLSDEERNELLEYIEGQLSDVETDFETADPGDRRKGKSGKGGGWY